MKNKKGENMKNRTLDIVKNKDENLTYNVIYKNKYTLATITKNWCDNGKYNYWINLIENNYGTSYEPFDAEDKRYNAFDRSLRIVENSIIDLMKEVRDIKRDERS